MTDDRDTFSMGLRKPSTHPIKSVRAMFDYADSAGISSIQLAARSGYAVRTVYGIRHGRNPSYRAIANIAEALGGQMVFSRTIQPPTKGT